MKRLAITVEEENITPYVALAREYAVGIEIQVYGYHPRLLDGRWQDLLEQHKASLHGFDGEIALHGAFYDMAASSVDPQVVALTRERYRLCMHIAAELGARTVIFHANYLPVIHHPGYRPEWTRRQVAFWLGLLDEIEWLDLTVALENMWEPEPDIIVEVLEQVGSPRLRACLDVGHVHLYSNAVPLTAWLSRLGNQVVHCHINNPRGLYDEHLPLDAEGGMIDYRAVLPLLEQLPGPPLVCLEMDGLANLKRSLHYVQRMATLETR
jgi:sugar phosphate isomerase/epimerase